MGGPPTTVSDLSRRAEPAAPSVNWRLLSALALNLIIWAALLDGARAIV